MADYMITKNYAGVEDGVMYRPTKTYIPICEANAMWRRYLEWVAEGNTADPYVPIDPEAI